jgi:hypothetical protein
MTAYVLHVTTFHKDSMGNPTKSWSSEVEAVAHRTVKLAVEEFRATVKRILRFYDKVVAEVREGGGKIVEIVGLADHDKANSDGASLEPVIPIKISVLYGERNN